MESTRGPRNVLKNAQLNLILLSKVVLNNFASLAYSEIYIQHSMRRQCIRVSKELRDSCLLIYS